ncbi:TPA: DUF4158 domain-containing protein [Enterobacter hormaechei]
MRDITVLAEYGQRENTRREHAALIRQHYQYREFADYKSHLYIRRLQSQYLALFASVCAKSTQPLMI